MCFNKILENSTNSTSSSGEKRDKEGESISNTPIILSSLIRGTTISELLAESQAIWPANSWTLSTRKTFCC